MMPQSRPGRTRPPMDPLSACAGLLETFPSLGLAVEPLIQCSSMSDWRQIQARIRKAKNSADPSTKLSELYQRTRDAMVAWELGVVEEKNGRGDQAVKWYTAAAQRFRRAEWKKKAEEALARLGAEIPAALEETAGGRAAPAAVPDGSRISLALGEIPETESPLLLSRESAAESLPSAPEDFPSGAAEDSGLASSGGESGNAGARPEAHRKRRRGRRGGRGRRRKSAAAASPSLPAQAFTPPPPETPLRTPDLTPRPPAAQPAAHGISSYAAEEQPPERRQDRRASGREEMPARAEYSAPPLPSERVVRGRAGDPALASRMAHLESMLRRLLSSPLHRLDELDDAPAGPGVFLLSDSDQITSYYVEACQTLRIGLGNVVRGGGGRGGKTRRPAGRGYSEGGDLKEKFAEHLGINQSKVAQYMKDHCIVRWIQLDDDAPHLAHFAIAVLRAPLNLE
jgi:hypothetical protein